MDYKNRVKHKNIYITIMCFLLFISMLLSIGLQTIYNNIGKLPWAVNQYSIIDIMTETDDVHNLFKQESSLMRLKGFYEDLISYLGLSYYVVSKQPVFIDEEPFPIEFAYGYGDYPEEFIDPEAFNSWQLNLAAFEGYKLNVYEGNTFSKEDFIIREDLNIPIIVGYKYKDVLSIGDLFNAEYLGMNFSFYVIGILEQNNMLLEGTALDYTIILPALEYSTNIEINDEISMFLKKMYLNHTNGIIVTDKKPITIQKTLDELSNKYSLSTYTMLGMPLINIMNMGIANSILFIRGISIIICILIIFLCSILLLKQINLIANKELESFNAIFIKKIIIKIYLQAAFCVIITSLFSYILLTLFFQAVGLPSNDMLYQTIKISVVTWFLMPLYPIFRIRNVINQNSNEL